MIHLFNYIFANYFNYIYYYISYWSHAHLRDKIINFLLNLSGNLQVLLYLLYLINQINKLIIII